MRFRYVLAAVLTLGNLAVSTVAVGGLLWAALSGMLDEVLPGATFQFPVNLGWLPETGCALHRAEVHCPTSKLHFPQPPLLSA